MPSNRSPSKPQATAADFIAPLAEISLHWFELPQALITPAVQACRLFNNALDAAFYNVFDLVKDLAARDTLVLDDELGQHDVHPRKVIDLDTLCNPEGSLLLIDTTKSPYVKRFHHLQEFLDTTEETSEVDIITITGVGSSALGSAAFAWEIASATERPVLAIVAGYGVADVIQQGMGGWFGFGMHNWLGSKAAIQEQLALFLPKTANIGRRLSLTAPDSEHTKTSGGAAVFRHGSGSSDVLHALLKHRPRQFKTLIGHSKGALVIGNAVEDLPPEATQHLSILTFGCPISPKVPHHKLTQVLGRIDTLGWMNSWGNLPSPDQQPLAQHTTNLYLWLPLHADKVSKEVIGALKAKVEAVPAVKQPKSLTKQAA
jgi:hypothetical protein